MSEREAPAVADTGDEPDERFDVVEVSEPEDFPRGMLTCGRCSELPSLAAALAVREDETARLRAENERLEALAKRLAGPASQYGARIYNVAFEPDIAKYLTDDELRRNGERPSQADERVAAERDVLLRRQEAALAALEQFEDIKWSGSYAVRDQARIVRAALSGDTAANPKAGKPERTR